MVKKKIILWLETECIDIQHNKLWKIKLTKHNIAIYIYKYISDESK